MQIDRQLQVTQVASNSERLTRSPSAARNEPAHHHLQEVREVVLQAPAKAPHLSLLCRRPARERPAWRRSSSQEGSPAPRQRKGRGQLLPLPSSNNGKLLPARKPPWSPQSTGPLPLLVVPQQPLAWPPLFAPRDSASGSKSSSLTDPTSVLPPRAASQPPAVEAAEPSASAAGLLPFLPRCPPRCKARAP
jgi:hypothetical protein